MKKRSKTPLKTLKETTLLSFSLPLCLFVVHSIPSSLISCLFRLAKARKRKRKRDDDENKTSTPLQKEASLCGSLLDHDQPLFFFVSLSFLTFPFAFLFPFPSLESKSPFSSSFPSSAPETHENVSDLISLFLFSGSLWVNKRVGSGVIEKGPV